MNCCTSFIINEVKGGLLILSIVDVDGNWRGRLGDLDCLDGSTILLVSRINGNYVVTLNHGSWYRRKVGRPRSRLPRQAPLGQCSVTVLLNRPVGIDAD